MPIEKSVITEEVEEVVKRELEEGKYWKLRDLINGLSANDLDLLMFKWGEYDDWIRADEEASAREQGRDTKGKFMERN